MNIKKLFKKIKPKKPSQEFLLKPHKDSHMKTVTYKELNIPKKEQ